MSAARATTALVKSSFADVKCVQAAMLLKLKESDLTIKDATRCGFEPMTVDRVSKLKGLPVVRAGFRIPYFLPSGKPSGFYRIRYLEYGEATARGLVALTLPTKKKLRYGQPAETVNQLYLPPLGEREWGAVLADPSVPLVITEGELKAACATKLGLWTVGLGGVWCFKAAKEGLDLLPEFDYVQWEGRLVYITYDSDAATNSAVVAAQIALARALLGKGAQPYICSLPQLCEGSKTGLDDYLVVKGREVFEREVMAKAAEFEAAVELFQLNEEVRYVTDPGIIIRMDTLQRMAPRAFTDHAYAYRTYHVMEGSADSPRRVEKSAPKEWIKWPHRATVQRITYAPGAERVTEAGEMNCWKGWACEPRKGDVRPWHRLLDALFRDTPVEHRRWFEQWLAYPLQHPGTKLFSAVVFWGLVQGTGKSMVGYTMFKIYGTANAREIEERHLEASFNDWAENRQFIMGDEITGGDKRGSADRMKGMITQKQLCINVKYIPSYVVPDCINYYFTSNHPDAFFLEDTDRRFFVHEVRGQPESEGFYAEYAAWKDSAEGPSALFDYFLNLDLTGFNPSGPAPLTRSKLEMISDGRSDVGTWVAELRENPDGVLKMGDKPLPYVLWSTQELFSIFDPDGRGRVTLNGLSRELKRARFEKAYGGMPILTVKAGQVKLWIVRPPEDKAELEKLQTNRPAVATLYDRERADGGRKRKF